MKKNNAICDKETGAAENIILLAFRKEFINDTDIRVCCQLHKAGYNGVFNLVRPYLDEADDRLFEKQVMRYRLNPTCRFFP